MPVLYQALFPRRVLFPLVPPTSEMARRSEGSARSQKARPELLCAYHRGNVERAEVQNWLFFFLATLTEYVFEVKSKFHDCLVIFLSRDDSTYFFLCLYWQNLSINKAHTSFQAKKSGVWIWKMCESPFILNRGGTVSDSNIPSCQDAFPLF